MAQTPEITPSLADDLTAEDIEAGRLLFARECNFFWGAPAASELPEADLPEVCFAGRSNVGKSSLVNALTGRVTLARTSQTPGRTQQLNFFNLGDRLVLVDMPGYGYAKVSKETSSAWTDFAKSYLKGRVTLRRALVLVDSRHGLKPQDIDMMKMMDQAAVAYQIVLTKADKLTDKALVHARAAVAAALVKHPAAHPEVMATSSESGLGIAELRATLTRLAAPAL
ncbi:MULTISPECIES: ribosome biogenesis GTP-binding protein YihA/YsxC [Rhodospirillales]|uniref:Probable GTP-binding protein EngB n=2 Tax=Rhodospirillales TaxID=204441 RepID=B6IPG9_RHOCS|nr:ribosome biogenesis GTP-binding protein YihA/YsxC [Rhodospirillum centenum]ACI99671.1 GTP-binding protein, putative [Rhodospirillum centenum SW]